jgi:cell wall-associated NlpC family hydrolase
MPEPSASPAPSETPEPTPTPTSNPSATESPAPTPSPSKKGTSTASIAPNEISHYNDYQPAVRKITDAALELTKRNLGYAYGSADPANGGMDCSGFVYYLLRQSGIANVPRDSSQQYVWVRKAGNFQAVLSRNADSFELDALKPGDLLFWTGTYSIDRDPPITHAMIYLGRQKGTNKRLMVGASDGRTYEGQQRFGVSVFDFKISAPRKGEEGKLSPMFVGYGPIPGLREHTKPDPSDQPHENP